MFFIFFLLHSTYQAAKEREQAEELRREEQRVAERAAERERRRVAEVEERRMEEQRRIEREEAAERAIEARRQTERQMREAEIHSGAGLEVVPASSAGASTLPMEPDSYWWDAHQNHKLDDRMEVCGSGIGEPNRHVRVYIHTTFKEFMEEVHFPTAHLAVQIIVPDSLEGFPNFHVDWSEPVRNRSNRL